MAIKDKAGFVYSITFPDNKIYIGVTSSSPEKRFKDHVSAAKTGNSGRNLLKIHRAILEHGSESAVIEIIDEFSNLKEAEMLEKEYIEDYASAEENGLNSTKGGQGVLRENITDEERERISTAQKKRFERQEERDRCSLNIRKWRLENPEAVKKADETRNSIVRSEEHRKKMSEKTKKFYEENPEAVQHSRERMKKVYEERPELKEQISRSLGGSPVEAIRDGVVVGRFPSMNSCISELNLNQGNANAVLKGKRNHTKGFTFRKVDS